MRLRCLHPPRAVTPRSAFSAPNINHLWAALLVEELVRQGVGLFVVCPGSRSTPLAVAVAENPGAESLVHWDERAAAFVALGWGRATGRPAAVITTSGTAVANLLPAAVEADADGVPLLLITADRPPELRETGANQTVRQPPIFQDVARWTLDWPVPTTAVPARWVLSTAAHAVHRTRQPPGPVHLNLPFREPLAAAPDGTDVEAYLGSVRAWVGGAAEDPSVEMEDETAGLAPWPPGPRFIRWTTAGPGFPPDPDRFGLSLGSPSSHSDSPLNPRWLVFDGRGVIVIGDMSSEGVQGSGWAFALRSAAERLGWPVLPDVRAPASIRRSDAVAAGAPVITNADLVLASAAWCERQRPEAVLHLGGRLVSKRLARFLTDAAPTRYVQVSASAVRNDPSGVVTEVVRRPAADYVLRLSEHLQAVPPDRSGGAWPRSWTAASRAAEDVVARKLTASGAISEPAIARIVDQSGAQVVAAASMPIRDVEAFAPVGVPLIGDVVANRGASGIDGTVATTAGYARGIDRGVALLIGDLALLHDQTSLALLRSGPSVVVVCINNDGGGIFHRLPVAGTLTPDTFERFFGTPHGLDFRHAAAQTGLAYAAPTTLAAFQADYRDAHERRLAGASTLIEVRTDRAEQTALRADLEAAVVEAVERVGPPWGPLP